MTISLSDFLDSLSVLGMFLATAAVSILSLMIGVRLGRTVERPTRGQEAQVRTMTGAAVGLLTFMLVFTFWIASSHFNQAREAVLDEAGVIGTAYMRADLLPEPYRLEIRNLLREYVDVRLVGIRSGNIEQASSREEEVRRRIWSRTMAAREETGNPIFDEFLRRSLSKFIALHTRWVGVQKEFNISVVVWAALYVIIALTMISVGFHAGVTNMTRVPVILVFVLLLSVLMFLIADLDTPQIGALRVNHWSMIELRNAMGVQNGKAEDRIE
jgi:hypothetical protein